jgi:hypothetical protein
MAYIRKENSTVIGIRLPPKELYYWTAYCQHTGLSVSEFIMLTMNAFIDLAILRPLYDTKIIAKIKNSIKGLDFSFELQPITFRVKNSVLKEWDEYCNRLKITRTAFIRQAVNFFYDQNPNEFPSPDALELVRLMNILYNLIQYMGLMDYVQITSIFQGVDDWLVTRMLNALEQQQLLGRKGIDTYIATTSADPTTNTMWVAELLERVNEEIKKPRQTKNNQDISIISSQENISLIGRIFEFLHLIIKNKEKELKSEHIGGELKQMPKKAKQAISELEKIFSLLFQVPFPTPK